MIYQVKSPILFIVFNRPEETSLVFESIKKAKPSKIYIAADGPRKTNDNDIVLCEETRKIVTNIDWECEVKTLLRTNNLGCKVAVSEAISWFFDNEPEGIILEDDCLPNEDFFRFADEMLEYYRYDNNVAHVCGCNFQDGIKRGDFSYYFSNITHVWGWAGWRRVWEGYNVNLSLLDEAIKNDFLAPLTDNKIHKLSMITSYKKVQNGQINTWDYQYSFLNIINNMLAVIPNTNMISNIGFNRNGTHTLSESVMANVQLKHFNFPIEHPANVIADKEADDYTLKKEIPPSYNVIMDYVKFYIKRLIA